MSGGYRFEKTKQGALKPVPDKLNGVDIDGQRVAFSHVVDCLEYVCLVVHGNMTGYIMRQMAPPKLKRPRMGAGGWT
jgi:hypothetical protein